MFLANKLNQGAGSPAAPTDAQFNYVTMLLHGDGTNGSQNNTFVDSSTNNFTITRNGNTTQGSFSPYGSNWANYFNGTSALAFPSNSAFAFDTGAYTVEMWVFITGVGSGGYSHFFNAGNATGSFGFAIYSDYSLNVFGYGTGGVIAGSANDITPNTWQHIAVCRSSTSSNSTKIYVNGVLKTTGTDSTNWNVTTTPSVGGLTSLSGYSTVGYISNCRIVKGTAVYTTAFTPSTTPLTAISGTSLLTCQSNRFIDNSTNNFAITVNGTPSVQRFNPFGASTAYSTSVIGGSGYFDGSGDSLSAPASSTNIPQSGDDYTVEAWIYLTAAGNVTAIYSGDSSGYFAYRSVGRFEFVSGALELRLTYTAPLNRWCHVAVTRQSGTVRMFVDGALTSPTVSSGTTTGNTDVLITGTTYYFGSYTNSTSGPFYGYISNFRIVKGTAVYTAAFTPPTSPLTAITNTAILLNNTNGAIFDNAMMNDLETAGNAQISTSVKKYGTGSLAFDGTGDWLYSPYTPNLDLGSGNFTVECWAYINATATQALFSINGSNSFSQLQVATSTSAWYLLISTANNVWVDTTTGGSYSANTWYHVAVVRNGSTFTLYVNGTSVLTQSASSALYPYGGATRVGQNSDNSLNFNGYIDDFRITKGYARYTTTFTPPTAAFPNIGPV